MPSAARGQSRSDAPEPAKLRRAFVRSSLAAFAVVSCVHVQLVEPRAHCGSCLHMHGGYLPSADHSRSCPTQGSTSFFFFFFF